MGGFLLDGCGVSDGFYPVKEIKVYHCSYCNKEHMYSLFEVKRKLTILFIKTLTFTTKYAVCCSKCKNGYYISDEQKEAILNNKVDIDVKSDGLYLKTKNAADENKYDDILKQIIN